MSERVIGWGDSCPGTGGGEGDEGSRKGEEAYAGGGGSGPLVAPPSTLCELGGGENRAVLWE